MSATVCYAVAAPGADPEVVVARLAELPFTAFELDEAFGGDAASGREAAGPDAAGTPATVRAYLPLADDSEALRAALEALAAAHGWRYTRGELADENWNARWEASFAPAEVGDFLRVRAPFHAPEPRFAIELEIVPEMSFGTGHHETTHLMAELLRDHPPSGKTVFDFGTGTGVLALVAARLGARRVVASDHDPRCVASTLANAARNAVALDEVALGDETDLPAGPFDLVVANIQRGVLVAAMPALGQRLAPAGQLWLSGILLTDLDAIDDAARAAGLVRLERRQRGSWLACRYAPTR